MRIIASFGELVRRASVLGKAEQSGDKEAIDKARIAHNEYKEICLNADELTTGLTYGELTPSVKPRE